MLIEQLSKERLIKIARAAHYTLGDFEYHGEDCPAEDHPDLTDKPGSPDECECGAIRWREVIKGVSFD